MNPTRLAARPAAKLFSLVTSARDEMARWPALAAAPTFPRTGLEWCVIGDCLPGPDRLPVLTTFAAKMPPGSYWRELRRLVRRTNLPDVAKVVAAFQRDIPNRTARMLPPEHEAFAALPEGEVTIFRGAGRDGARRYSWSTSRAVAGYFAADWDARSAPKPDRVVHVGAIAKSDILAMFATDGALELVVDPARVRIIATINPEALADEAFEFQETRDAAKDDKRTRALWRQEAGRATWADWWAACAGRLVARGWMRPAAELAVELTMFAHHRVADPGAESWQVAEARKCIADLGVLLDGRVPEPPEFEVLEQCRGATQVIVVGKLSAEWAAQLETVRLAGIPVRAATPAELAQLGDIGDEAGLLVSREPLQ